MDRLQIEALLNEVRDGRTGVDDALERLKNLPFEDLGFAKVDHHRALRTGMPEVIFAESKTPAQVAAIFERMAKAGGNVLATRASRGVYEAVCGREPRAEFHEAARAITLKQTEPAAGKGTVGVVCAGTSDLPVAEEAAVTARLMGNTVELVADVGVAGIHRLLAQQHTLQSARVLIVCAGMEGALPTVVGGLVNAPVHRGSHERGLWCIAGRRGRAAGHAEHLRAECVGGEYRQRIRRGVHCVADQSSAEHSPASTRRMPCRIAR